MSEMTQLRTRRKEDEPRFVVGMDAHAHKLAISIWDWSDRFNARLHGEVRCVDLDAMVKTYERHVDPDSVTVIEASTNSASLKMKLEAAGFRAEVVRSDILAGKERRRKVCDIQDARNLAAAYIKGDVREFVWTPSGEHSERRDIVFAYRDVSKELTRVSNRIWSLCSRKGCPLPPRNARTKAERVRQMVRETGIGGFAKEMLEALVDDYERLRARKEALSRRIAEIVLSRPEMIRLMQLQGIGHRGAFTIASAVGDVRRFPRAAKLAAYFGFASVTDTSGDEEEAAKKRGGTGKALDGEGRRDAKYFLTEAGQTTLSSCAASRLGKWGWAMINRGKPRNKVVCAIGHKLALYAYHILRGAPTPNRDDEGFFRRKMILLHQTVGAKRMHELGYGTREKFADEQAKRIYGEAPTSPAGQVQ